MLFEPTFINPDMRNGLGAGVVDVTKNLVVSWRVNGQPYLAAYQITIYENTAAGTQVYTTGKLTTNCPFYAYSADGEQQTFSHTISAADMSTAGMANGNEYKMLITQWWDASAEHDEDSKIVQSSASVFITRAAPTLTLATFPVPWEAGPKYTFTATYSQAQGDTLNWVRWRIFFYDENYMEQTVYDSGALSGVAQLQLFYDGFAPGVSYGVQVTIETESGVTKTATDFYSFEQPYSELDATVVATKVCNGSAVKVDFSGISYIPGTASGTYSVSDGKLTLATGAKVTWSKITNKNIEILPQWCIVWHGTLTRTLRATLFTATTAGVLQDVEHSVFYETPANTISGKGEFRFRYDVGGSGFPITTETIESDFEGTADVTVILTPYKLYLRIDDTLTTTLYPSNTLYPSDLLYPMQSGAVHVQKSNTDIQYFLADGWESEQQALKKLSVGGNAVVDYVQVLVGDASATLINEAYENNTYSPTFTDDTRLLADFSDGTLNAGRLKLPAGTTISDIAIYRAQSGNSVWQKVAAPTGALGYVLYDYGVRSQQGEYQYIAWPENATSMLSQYVSSNKVNPCFWNWTVLECYQTTAYVSGLGMRPVRNNYTVLNEYAFGKNLSSGTMSNNNTPSVRPNLTRYPTVQLSRSNYQSGTLTSLIGTIDGDAVYSDTIALRDAIYNLSTTKNTLFLKNRKGDLLKIQLNGAVSMTTMDDTREQAQNVTFPWVEVGSAENVSLIAYENGGV